MFLVFLIQFFKQLLKQSLKDVGKKESNVDQSGNSSLQETMEVNDQLMEKSLSVFSESMAPPSPISAQSEGGKMEQKSEAEFSSGQAPQSNFQEQDRLLLDENSSVRVTEFLSLPETAQRDMEISGAIIPFPNIDGKGKELEFGLIGILKLTFNCRSTLAY
jgi:hypothetical protein